MSDRERRWRWSPPTNPGKFCSGRASGRARRGSRPERRRSHTGSCRLRSTNRPPGRRARGRLDSRGLRAARDWRSSLAAISCGPVAAYFRRPTLATNARCARSDRRSRPGVPREPGARALGCARRPAAADAIWRCMRCMYCVFEARGCAEQRARVLRCAADRWQVLHKRCWKRFANSAPKASGFGRNR